MLDAARAATQRQAVSPNIVSDKTTVRVDWGVTEGYDVLIYL